MNILFNCFQKRRVLKQEHDKEPTTGLRDSMKQVLAVFPDLQLEHASKLLEECDDDAAEVIEYLASNEYPTDEIPPEPKYDYMSTESFQPTKDYKSQSVEQIVLVFPFLSKANAKALLKECSYHYAIAHEKIYKTIMVPYTARSPNSEESTSAKERQKYKTIETILAKRPCPMSAGQIYDLLETMHIKARASVVFLCYCHLKQKRYPVTNGILFEEMEYVRRKLQARLTEVQSEISRHMARETARQNGTAVECACCFDQYAFEEMVSCRDEGHLFCRECFSSYMETQVFANGSFGVNHETKEPNLELVCFHGDGCTSGFHRSLLKKALKPKVLQKYDELQTRRAIELAGLQGDLCTCPECGLEVEVPENQNVFECPRCEYESCRHCGEAAHFPFRCETKSEVEGRARVEEAATAAVIRTCPKCKKGVIKQDGCNKITCACGAKWCYLCQKTVKDYTHFCQTPHCQHSNREECRYRCPLYTKDSEDDELRMRAAVLVEAERVEKAGNGVQVDVESILNGPR